jgi:hypothetical protein
MASNLNDIIGSKLHHATGRIKNDFDSILELEKTLKTPNLTTLQLNQIEESLNNIEARLKNFSYKSISESNKQLFLTSFRDVFLTYINERNVLQSKLLSLQNRVDTRLLIHKKREKEKNKILADELSEIQNKLKLILKDILDFDLDSPFTQLLEHYRLINRNLNKILGELEQDNFNLFKEGEEYKLTFHSLITVKNEFLKLKNSITNKIVPISDMVRTIESIKMTYGDKIPLYEIYESFNPIKKEEIDNRLNEAISGSQHFPNMVMELFVNDNKEKYLLLSKKESIQESKVANITTLMTSERRYEIFKRVLRKFQSIKISMLATLLGMTSENEVLEYILETPDEFGFKIQGDSLVIEQHDVLEHIDLLMNMFETDQNKENKT